MDFGLSEEQEMLKNAARDFLTDKCPKKLVREMEQDELGYSPQLWQQMADLGWMGLAFPEKYGGSDMSFLDLAILLEEMGRACLPGPFFPTVLLAGLPILDAGTEAQKAEYLPQIASGKAIFTLALTEAGAGYDAASIQLPATPDNSVYTLNGTKLFVPDAHVADYLLCAARTGDQGKPEDGITVFIVDTSLPGISITPLQTIARDKLCEVVLNGVRVPGANILGKLDEGWSVVRKALERAAVAKCCEMVGGMQAVLEMTVEHAKQRVQFGVAIGTFQAIQHHCANILTDVDSSRVITYEAAWKISKGLPCTETAAMAKSWVSEAYRQAVKLGTQVHGGVGIIEDHDMPLYFRRAKAAELAFGDARFHRKTIAQGLKL